MRGATEGTEAAESNAGDPSAGDGLARATGQKESIADLSDPQLYFGRDLSWLEFNVRVLAQAQDPGFPLLERVKFLAISASNLDEFFMKRMALLKRRIEAGLELTSHDGRNLRQQYDAIRSKVLEFIRAQSQCYEQELRPALADAGIRITPYNELDPDDRRRVDVWFQSNVFPVLTPLSVDPGHRFPFISNLSENLGVLLAGAGSTERNFARLKIPDPIVRMVPLNYDGSVGRVVDPTDVRLIPLDEVIRHNLDDVFPGMTILDTMSFRVTRSVGLEHDGDEIDDLLEHVEAELRQRRFADVVRLEVTSPANPSMLEFLLEELELDEREAYSRQSMLEYGDLLELVGLNRPDLKLPKWIGVTPPRLRDEDSDIFSIIRERDVFVHHPYESFDTSVERFVAAAAQDPNVLAIKQTLYRTSRDSPFVSSLIHAAEEGKAVACLVELRARFDEDKNVRFARQLEKHGVHVAYGVVGMKTHCKCSLVVRREADGLRCYAHIGTGNYHPGTAQLYTDCGMLTADPAITEDVVNLFNYLTGRSVNRTYQRLIVAPMDMRHRLCEQIDREADFAKNGGEGRIIAKMNALEDTKIISHLYNASRAGVKITLIVRGFCCLRPGVPGISENIRVISVVGRFLEHARIFHFGGGRPDPVDGDWFIGSADWMSRNLDHRVEVLMPVSDREGRERLARVIEVNLQDRLRAWILGPYGSYQRLTPGPNDEPDSTARIGTFERLCRDAAAMGRG